MNTTHSVGHGSNVIRFPVERRIGARSDTFSFAHGDAASEPTSGVTENGALISVGPQAGCLFNPPDIGDRFYFDNHRYGVAGYMNPDGSGDLDHCSREEATHVIGVDFAADSQNVVAPIEEILLLAGKMWDADLTARVAEISGEFVVRRRRLPWIR